MIKLRHGCSFTGSSPVKVMFQALRVKLQLEYYTELNDYIYPVINHNLSCALTEGNFSNQTLLEVIGFLESKM